MAVMTCALTCCFPMLNYDPDTVTPTPHEQASSNASSPPILKLGLEETHRALGFGDGL